jgi:beta-phosphoglucomutase-like phosphatase (HAD superfamily)
MDGLLLDTERVAMHAFCELAGALGLSMDHAEAAFLGLIGSSHQQTQRKLAHILPSGTDLERFSAEWSVRFGELIAVGIPLRPYALEAVSTLAERGHAMAVVTSTRGAHAREQLDRVGLLGHLQKVIGGDEVTANKPDPAPYLAGAMALDRDPSDCFAFEDSDTGVTSAAAAGCKVVQIPDLRPKDVAFPRLGQTIARDLNDAMIRSGLLPSGL